MVTTGLRSRAGLLAVSGGALLWGTTGVAVRIVHDRSGLSAVSIGWFRLLIATLVLVGAGLASGLRGGPGMRGSLETFRRHRMRLVVSGLGFGAYQALYFVGVQYVGVSVSTLVSLGIAPIALMIGASVARRRLPAPSSLAVLVAAIVGLALISLRPHAGVAPHPMVGVLASVASGLGYAAITAISRRMAGENPFVLTGITSAIGTVLLLPFALVAGASIPSDAVSNGWLVYIGVVPTIAAYWFFYRGMRSTSPEVAGLVSMLEPLAAAVLAAIVLHESLSGAGRIGGALMLVAVASLYVRHPAEAPPPP